MEEQVIAYENALQDYVIFNKYNDNDDDIYKSKDYFPDNFETFLSFITENNLVGTTSEMLNYRSYNLQKTSAWLQCQNADHERTSLGYAKINYDVQYKTLDNTKSTKNPSSDIYIDVGYQEMTNKTQLTNLSNQFTFVSTQDSDLLYAKESGEKQKKLMQSQIDYFEEKNSLIKDNLINYYKEYLNLNNKLKVLKRQKPVNYLTDGKIVKGFNNDGRLVAIFDKYENTITIEYDESDKIVAVYDGEDKQIVFEYRPDGLLGSITDTRGRRTVYDYSGTVLNKVLRPDGTVYAITLIGDEFTEVKVYENEKQQGNSKPIGISTVSKTENVATVTNKTCVWSIENGKINYLHQNTWKTLNTLKITLDSGLTTISEVESNKNTYYGIRDEDKVYAYYVEENNKVTTAELYDYEAYDRDYTQQAKRSSLYTKPYSSFSGDDFVGGDSVNTVLDEFNNPATVTTNAQALSTGTTTQTTVNYTYNDDHKCIKEEAIVTIKEGTSVLKTYTQITAYNYNAAGNVVRKESYIQGEEYTTGKSIEETEYDANGNAVRSFSYNSLDSSSKFYTESDYAENGQTLADYDETGENKTEYEYISGTNVVREEKMPNGSKFAYGYDENDTVTSITQSTEEGEENSTHTRYTCGEVTELVSGNNKVNYAYDAKRRLSKVKLNGADYMTITTTDATNTTVETAKIKYIARGNDENANSDYYEVTKNKRGDVVSVKYAYDSKTVATPAYAELYTNVYDGKNRVVQITQGTATLESNEYDNYDRQTKHTFGAHVHETEYNGYGQTSKDIIKFGNDAEDKLEYVYAYDDEKASRPMTGMTAGAFGESYVEDVSGRSIKLTQTLGGNIYTKRYGYYKQGDHATNRVNTVYYGKNGVTDGKVTYTYDGMGNIVSVNENGKQHYKYAYDKIGRLILEKDLYKNREVCYTYDNNGNILTKSIDGEVTGYRYKEGTDQLVSFGTESIAYDNMGNPTTYKGMACAWEKGRQLASITDGENTVTYTYDVKGLRTSKTVGGAITNYVYENGKLLRQITDNEVMDFIYGSKGVIGFRIRNSAENTEKNYLYRKNLFGDITGIIDESGALVYEYTYSAFGKSDKDEETGIGAKNPFRYRGYYYDDETGLYYLKSRYYDSEVGRFITIDDISYIDPETINGLNLYAYCGNNPVMRTDSQGANWWTDFWNGVGNWFQNNWQQLISGLEIVAGVVCIFIPGLQGVSTVLLSMGISSLVAGYINQMTGGTFSAGWFGGQISGLFSALGGFAAGFVGGALGNLTTGLIDKYYYKKDISLESIYFGSLFSGIVNGLFTFATPSIDDFAFKVTIENDWYNLAALSFSGIFSAISAFRSFILGLVAGYSPNITKRLFK